MHAAKGGCLLGAFLSSVQKDVTSIPTKQAEVFPLDRLNGFTAENGLFHAGKQAFTPSSRHFHSDVTLLWRRQHTAMFTPKLESRHVGVELAL